MNKTAKIFLSLFAALAVVFGGVTPALAFNAPNGDVQRILDDTNAARAGAGLSPLILNESLTTVAQNWSQRQASDGRMYHNPDYSTQIPGGWTGAAENVAYGYAVSEVTTGWMNSEGHRKNILGDYNSIGIGIQDGYYTQVFAKYSQNSSTPVEPEPIPQEPTNPAPKPVESSSATPTQEPITVESPVTSAPVENPPLEPVEPPKKPEPRATVEPAETLPEEEQLMTIQGGQALDENAPSAVNESVKEGENKVLPKPLLIGILTGAGLLLIGAVIALVLVLRRK